MLVYANPFKGNLANVNDAGLYIDKIGRYYGYGTAYKDMFEVEAAQATMSIKDRVEYRIQHDGDQAPNSE